MQPFLWRQFIPWQLQSQPPRLTSATNPGPLEPRHILRVSVAGPQRTTLIHLVGILALPLGVPARGGPKHVMEKCRSAHFPANRCQNSLRLTRDNQSRGVSLPPALSPGCPQSLSRSFKNSSTSSNSFTSAKLIACVASLSTRPVFFHASHKSRMARAQTISDSMGQTTIL